MFDGLLGKRHNGKDKTLKVNSKYCKYTRKNFYGLHAKNVATKYSVTKK